MDNSDTASGSSQPPAKRPRRISRNPSVSPQSSGSSSSVRGPKLLKRLEPGTASGSSRPPAKRPRRRSPSSPGSASPTPIARGSSYSYLSDVSAGSSSPTPTARRSSDSYHSDSESDSACPGKLSREEDPDDLLHLTTTLCDWTPKVWEPPYECHICNRKNVHYTAKCPYMFHATQLGVFHGKLPKQIKHYFYKKHCGVSQHGYGVSFFAPPGPGEAERSAAEAKRLHEEHGLNLVRITHIPKVNNRPKRLYKRFKRFGCVTHAIVFRKQGFGFINFKREEAAMRAIKELTCLCYGIPAWAAPTSA